MQWQWTITLSSQIPLDMTRFSNTVLQAISEMLYEQDTTLADLEIHVSTPIIRED